MNRYLLLLGFLISTIAWSQQIVGTTIDIDGNPISGLTILLDNIETFTNEDGTFSIEQSSNSATLRISGVGYKTKEIDIHQNDLGDIIMYEGIELLDIQTQGTRTNKFARKETAYVGKMSLKDMETATVYSTISNELLESQIVTTIDDALKNATGITKLWESTGRTPSKGTGYFSTRGFATQPALVDGLAGSTFSSVDPSYIERIEVIKGPAATLFGSTVSSLGGLVNVVTKKPYKGLGGSISYTAGSFDLHRITGDFNTPISKENDIYFRLNASYLNQNSFQDNGFRKTFFVAPSLSYRVNNKLNLSIGLEYAHNEQTNPTMLFVRRGADMLSNSPKEMGLDPEKSFTSDDITLKSPNLNIRAIADYKLSDNWTSQTLFSITNSSVEGYYQYMYEGASISFFAIPTLLGENVQYVQDPINQILGEAGMMLQQDVLARVFDYRDGKSSKQNIQQNFIGDFKLGNMRNRMVVGLDFVNRSSEYDNKSGNPYLAQTSAFPDIINTFNYAIPGAGDQFAMQLATFPYFDGFFLPNGDVYASSFTPNAQYEVSQEQLENVFSQVEAIHNELGSKTYAVYVSNVLNITDRLIVNFGLRLDHFDQDGNKDNPDDDYTKTNLSPMGGVVYQVVPKNLTLFTNYQTGFINNDPQINADGSTQTLDPTKAHQFEVGFKTSITNGKLSGGISYYNITVNDIVGSDPTAILFPQSIMFEEFNSSGVEMELNANPMKGLNLRASYAYNDAKYTDTYSSTTDTTYPQIDNRRTPEAGPRNIYNFWADYKFDTVTSEFFNNLGLGIGFNGATEQLTMNDGVSGRFILPAYTLVNAAIYYDTAKFRIGVKGNNLTDEVYYNGWSTINPQAPRSFLGVISYKF